VFPGRPFKDLSHQDFMVAAEVTAECFSRRPRVSECMLEAIEQTTRRCPSNVNLGIVLLLGPLVGADWILEAAAEPNQVQRSSSQWRDAIARQLEQFDETDGRNVYRTIRQASAGGLGRVDTMDVHDDSGRVDLVAAMNAAADRDRIARQYANGFADVLDRVTGELLESITEAEDLLQGICRAHVKMLAADPDSLISRKNGKREAVHVQSLARAVDLDDPASYEVLDKLLRDSRHRLNPGTTADLIAAGLYLLLRSPPNTFRKPTEHESG
jgi:triphosphoribosyl-dephospho-CoA synthase